MKRLRRRPKTEDRRIVFGCRFLVTSYKKQIRNDGGIVLGYRFPVRN